MRHERAMSAHIIAHHARDARVFGYLAEWYTVYRKRRPCGPKVRLRTNRTAGSLSLLHRETSISVRHGGNKAMFSVPEWAM